ncbi:MAG: GntR family transcriptional regulator [Spirochaetales bacterium]|nr:MAG: GntR family transcriptional regulator [Spirochaetales bacterium]
MDFKGLALDKDVPIPLYYQLKEILLEEIKNSEAGVIIPPEMELCSRFGISRPTVRQAITELVSEGYLTRQKGRGTFISTPKIKQDFLLVLESFNDEMQHKGLTPATKVLEFEQAKSDERVSEMLKLKLGSDVVKLRRLRFTNGEPIVLVLSFLPFDKLPSILTRNMEKDSLYRILEKEYGYTIERTLRTLESRLAGEYEAEVLGLKKGAAIQYIETVAFLTGGDPVEFSMASYRGDRNKFTFELRKQA